MHAESLNIHLNYMPRFRLDIFKSRKSARYTAATI